MTQSQTVPRGGRTPRRMGRRAGGLLLIALLLWPPGLPAAPRPAGATRQEELSRQAKEAFLARRYPESLGFALQALALEPEDTATIFNVARLHELLGQLPEAAGRYQDFLERNPEAKERQAVQRRIDKLAASLQGTHCRLRVLTDPQGAEVSLRALEEPAGAHDLPPYNELGTSPLVRWLKPGRYTIRVAREGYDLHDEEIELRLLNETLLRTTLSQARREGYLALSGDPPGARVEIDGALRGQLPLAGPLFLSPGRHDLRIVRQGYTPWEQVIEVRAQETLQLHAELIALPPAEAPDAAAPEAAAAPPEPDAEHPAVPPEAPAHPAGELDPDARAPSPAAAAATSPETAGAERTAHAEQEQRPLLPLAAATDQPETETEIPDPWEEAPPAELPAAAAEPRRTGPSAMSWTFLGLGLGGLLTGGAVGVLFLEARQEIDDYRALPQADKERSEYDSLVETAELRQLISNIGWGVAAVGLGTGLATWLWGGDDAGADDTTDTVAWRPVVRFPHGAGMEVRW